jgi:hypothetical protein
LTTTRSRLCVSLEDGVGEEGGEHKEMFVLQLKTRNTNRDCNDFDHNVRPGRASAGLDPTVDWNCNGIYGVNPTTGK